MQVGADVFRNPLLGEVAIWASWAICSRRKSEFIFRYGHGTITLPAKLINIAKFIINYRAISHFSQSRTNRTAIFGLDR